MLLENIMHTVGIMFPSPLEEGTKKKIHGKGEGNTSASHSLAIHTILADRTKTTRTWNMYKTFT